MITSTLLLPETADKPALLQAFATHCSFGEGFGFNWDALWDSFNDWLERQQMPLCLIINGEQVRQLDTAAWQQCRQILDDACTSWPQFSYRLEAMAQQEDC